LEAQNDMGVFIGMDEAGYGPNLGPLVITATVWDLPKQPDDVDLWSTFADVVDQVSPGGGKIHVADSKQVYSPNKGLAHLEHSVHCLLALNGDAPLRYTELCRRLLGGEIDVNDCGPWLKGCDLDLPQKVDSDAISEISARWRSCCQTHSIGLRTVVSDIVTPRRFNRLLAEYGTKGVLLSKLSMQLLSRVIDFDNPEPTLVIADKHGGRNRYDELLADIAGDRFIVRETEGRAASSYRIGTARIRFQTRAEEHLPVAAASLVCKYVRELSMELFNIYWQKQLPGVKPTKGYPVDAKRFRQDIAATQTTLGVTDEVLWRAR
jgi:ribonuclease HII